MKMLLKNDLIEHASKIMKNSKQAVEYKKDIKYLRDQINFLDFLFHHTSIKWKIGSQWNTKHIHCIRFLRSYHFVLSFCFSITVWELPVRREIIVDLSGGECYEANQPCTGIITFLNNFHLPIQDCPRTTGFKNDGTLFYLRNKTSIPIFYCGNKIWVWVWVRMN